MDGQPVIIGDYVYVVENPVMGSGTYIYKFNRYNGTNSGTSISNLNGVGCSLGYNPAEGFLYLADGGWSNIQGAVGRMVAMYPNNYTVAYSIPFGGSISEPSFDIVPDGQQVYVSSYNNYTTDVPARRLTTTTRYTWSTRRTER
jgi:hypothetical protein